MLLTNEQCRCLEALSGEGDKYRFKYIPKESSEKEKSIESWMNLILIS